MASATASDEFELAGFDTGTSMVRIDRAIVAQMIGDHEST